MKTSRGTTWVIFLFIGVLLATFTIGCKKDRLKVDRIKEYIDMKHVPAHFLDGPMHLILRPDGTASFNPRGDVMSPSSYNISGSTIKVHGQQITDVIEFRIISETEIKHKTSGIILTYYK
ncbi:hypothetical protein GZH53_12805 [Flavihumibacter sp. R14]|nr:hypothetical protein [Flavihumibacter soli]